MTCEVERLALWNRFPSADSLSGSQDWPRGLHWVLSSNMEEGDENQSEMFRLIVAIGVKFSALAKTWLSRNSI